ncbi:HAD-IIB family hydrolase [Herbiconiux sp. L3-i23]|uniref:HAD-IIB family hydrolase n=1 Tax=Herbiconiux sp. L3-i23 TaxID=2905871 RepID=UPI002068EEC8|nr:HAD-IIB family hydrolase [Herbiconiux sp. L3-i23]BDI21659.1 haloacid dehalogenase [Herbiconiux sp. L3-i23]
MSSSDAAASTPADAWSGTWMPELVAFDLDDTLAPSKSPVDPRMLELFSELLDVAQVCVISGGQIGQFRAQLLDRLSGIDEAKLARLHLMPTCGTQYWRFGPGGWTQVYAENLTSEQIADAFASLERRAKELGYWESETWGPILEDRGSQVTFSALGQEAPVDIKRAWDPTGEKKNTLRAAVQDDLPELEARSGGSTSIDITRSGIDKAYGMEKLVQLVGIPIERMLFIGDRLDPEGNDYPVKSTGVATHAVDGWQDTAAVVERLVATARS